MARHDVLTFDFDQYNITEMVRHGVTDREVNQLLRNRRVVTDNPHGAPDSVLLIGETDGGRLLSVPLVPTHDPGVWRPATAFDASRHQRTIFDRRYR